MKTKLLLLLAFLLPASLLLAGTTGKIAGKVTDAQTGEVLAATNITVVGTNLGAATNSEGEYVILQVEPGTYDLRVSLVGYQPQVIQGVRVSIDLTTPVNVTLTPTAVELPEMTVIATQPMIERTLTHTKQEISSAVIEQLPITQVKDIVATLPGVVESVGKIHLRGSRAGEELYLVDGGVVSNPLFGGSAVQISPVAVKDLEVISGTFNAEYGNALSGVINQVLKEGSDERWNLKLGARTSIYSLNNSEFGGIGHFKGEGTFGEKDVYEDLTKSTFDSLSKSGIIAPKSFGNKPFYILDATVGGPLMENVRFFAAGRYYSDPTGLPGQEQTYWTINPKISYSFAKSKVFVSGTYNDEERPYDPLFDPNRIDPDRHPWWSWKYNLDAFPKIEDQTYQFGLHFTHTPSANSYVDVRADFLRKKTRTFAKDEQGNELNYLEERPTYSLNLTQSLTAGGQGYYDRSIPFTYYGVYSEDIQQSSTLEASYVDQLTTSYELKAGGKLVLYSIERIGRDLSFGRPNPDGRNTQNIQDEDGSPVNPFEVASYVQNRIELGSFILNAGLRLDVFSLNLSNAVWTSPFNPFTGKREDTETFFKVSPRIGVSHPVGERTAVHYSYGTFFRRPNFYDLLDNFRVHKDNPLTGAETGYFLYIGNPGLKPEETTIYEVGVQQQLWEDYRLEVTGYYKDIDNLVGLQEFNTNTIVDSTTVPGRQFVFQHFWSKTSVHYGSVRGLEVSFEKRVGPELTGRVSYTFSEAIGTASGSVQAQAGVFNEGRATTQNTPFMTNLDFDRPHLLNGYINYNLGDRPDILSNIGINLKFNIQSGLPLPIQRFSPKRDRAPSTSTLDLRVYKLFKLDQTNFEFYVQVENLLNQRNVITVKDPSSYFDETSPYYQNAAGPANDLTAYGRPVTVFVGFVFDY